MGRLRRSESGRLVRVPDTHRVARCPPYHGEPCGYCVPGTALSRRVLVVSGVQTCEYCYWSGPYPYTSYSVKPLRSVNGTYVLQQGPPGGGGVGVCMWTWASPEEDYALCKKHYGLDCTGGVIEQCYARLGVSMRAMNVPSSEPPGYAPGWRVELQVHGHYAFSVSGAFMGTYTEESGWVDCSAPVPSIANEYTLCTQPPFPEQPEGRIGYNGYAMSPS